MFQTYMRANPDIETGFGEPNHLFLLVAKSARWHKQYKTLFKTEFDLHFRPAIKVFTEAHYGSLMKVTGRKVVVLKHPWLVPYIRELTLHIFPDSKVVMIQRHPYDVIASSWAMYSKNPKGKKVFEKQGQVSTIDDMCELFITYLGHVLEAKKYLRGRGLMVKYEDIIAKPVEMFGKIYNHYGAPLSEKKIEEIVEHGVESGLPMLGGFMSQTKLEIPKSHKWEKWLAGADKKKVRSKVSKFLPGLDYDDK